MLINATRLIFAWTAIVCALLMASAGAAQTAVPESVEVPAAWVSTYTPEELGAIDRALWAGNFTREDLNFRKDFARGYQCLPIVKDMLHEPMTIAPNMDAMINGINFLSVQAPSPFAEVLQSLSYYRGITMDDSLNLIHEYESSRDWNPQGEFPDFRELNVEERAGGAPNDVLFDNLMEQPFRADARDLLRQYLPLNMSWHDVFESPYSQEQRSTWEEEIKDKPADFIYALASETDFYQLAENYMLFCPDPRSSFTQLPADFWPTEPIVVEKDGYRVAIGTLGDDEWEGDFDWLIDPGGNDHYKNCRIGAAYGTDGKRFGYFADLGGNDFYDCGDVNITCGAAILGVAAFYDLGQGNDRYVTGSCALGAAIGGIATFYDDGGSDTYEGKVYTMGAAGFGIGVMVDDSVGEGITFATDVEPSDPIDITLFDNDTYNAWTNSQAFARTLGVAICSNKRGNDIYSAGGVYLDAPLFADRFQSFSQGFAIGERGIDYAGGIAMIVDYAGNDKYLGDIYNQGVGYWYSAGFLYDGGGNDTYEMTQYGQGSGIHLAVGGLIDCAGTDSYTMHSGLGTGGSHDFAASVLHDRGGNDQYFGNSSCNGGSLTNSAVIFIDRSGDDTYAARREGGINFGRPERGFVSIGVLVDLGGNDDYLGIMDNGMMWNQTDVGVGWDITPPPVPEGAVEAPAERGQLGENVPIPEIISYQGELTQEVFTELWDIATRWAVGDNRFIVPKAIDRLIAFGPPVLPFLSEEFKDDRSGLAYDPFNRIMKAVIEQDRAGVLDILRTNLASGDSVRMRVAMAAITDMKLMDLESDLAALLDDPDPYNQRRAIGTLASIGSHVADERLKANLDPAGDEALIKASMDSLFTLESADYALVRPLLSYPYITVREDLVSKLIEKTDTYAQDFRNELQQAANPSGVASEFPPLDIRGLRSILKVWSKAALVPEETDVSAIMVLLEHEDWGVRADAIRVVRHWQQAAKDAFATGDDPSAALDILELLRPAVSKILRMESTETDPYVLYSADQGQ